MKIFSYRQRPVHLGPFPMERLKRAPLPPRHDGTVRPSRPPTVAAAAPHGIAPHARSYLRLYERFREGEVALERALIPVDPAAIVHDLKSAAYFFDASMVAACDLPDSAWYDGVDPDRSRHTGALAIVVEHGREPEPDNLAAHWVDGTQDDRTALRAAEIAVVLAGYIRNLGWPARAHTRVLASPEAGR